MQYNSKPNVIQITHKDEKPLKTIVPNGKREGQAQKDEKPMKTIEESIGTRMSNECDTQKPVKTIVFRVRAEQGCHSLMRMIINKALRDWIWFDTKTKNL